jgi:hypothetical protein
MNLLFRHLDCPWKKEASVPGAANVVDLFWRINVRLGDDDQALCNRQLERLDAPTRIPVGPCSDPLAQYIKMLLGVREHQLEMHRKLQVNTATRFLLRLMSRPPVATGRALHEALGKFHRHIRQQVRMSDHSPDAIRALLEQAAAKLANASFDGILLPHGTKKPPGGYGAAYWGQSGGASRSSSAGSVDRRRCHQCGKEGHLREACPDSQPTCHGCGKVGHIRPQCPDRQLLRSRSVGVRPVSLLRLSVILARRLRISGRLVRWDSIVRIEATRRSAPSGIRRRLEAEEGVACRVCCSCSYCACNCC